MRRLITLIFVERARGLAIILVMSRELVCDSGRGFSPETVALLLSGILLYRVPPLPLSDCAVHSPLQDFPLWASCRRSRRRRFLAVFTSCWHVFWLSTVPQPGPGLRPLTRAARSHASQQEWRSTRAITSTPLTVSQMVEQRGGALVQADLVNTIATKPDVLEVIRSKRLRGKIAEQAFRA